MQLTTKILSAKFLITFVLCATFLVSAPHCLSHPSDEVAVADCADHECAHDSEHAPCLDTIAFRTAVLSSKADLKVFTQLAQLLLVSFDHLLSVPRLPLLKISSEQTNFHLKIQQTTLIRTVVLLV